MTSPPKTSPKTAADQLAFGSIDRAKYYWVDELGTLRTEKLWWLVDAVKELRADLSRRLEELYQRTRAIPKLRDQIAGHTETANHLQISVRNAIDLWHADIERLSARLDALEARESKKKP